MSVAQRPSDVVVLGAGPAGLSAAWQAARAGLQVTVLEKNPYVGGLAASTEIAGVRVDAGSHRLHPATPAPLLADLQELLGDDLQLRRRNGRLRLGPTWVGFPLSPLELARRLPRQVLLALARDAAAGPLRRAQSDTYAGHLRASLGPTAYDLIYGPYARKLWGTSGEHIAADQARTRVTADTPLKVAGRIARGALPRRLESSGVQGRAFWYPRRGFGQIVEALATAATAAGARVITSAEVERLAVRADGVQIRLRDGRDVQALRALSTLPLPLLARIASPGAPLGAIEAASRLRFRAMTLVYLVHQGGRWTGFDAHYFPGPETPVTRISEPANYRNSVDDPTDRSVLCAEIPCAVGDEVWDADDDSLAALVVAALTSSGLPPVRLGGVVVSRVRAVYPVYSLGYADSLTELQGWADGLPTVTTLGRLGLFAHDNTHHALAMGYAAAEALGPAGSWNAGSWAAARRRFQEHVVED